MSEVVIPQKRRFKRAHVVTEALIRKANQDTIGDLAFADFEVNVNRDAKTFTFALTEAADESKYTETHSISFTYQRATLADVMQAIGFKTEMGAVTNKDAVVAALPEGLTNSWDEGSRTLTVKVAPETTKFGFSGDDHTSVTTFLDTEESFQITFTEVQEETPKVDVTGLITVTEVNFTVEDLLEETEV